MEKEKQNNSFMMKLSTLIVDKRKGFYLIFIMLIIFSVFSMNRVKVNNDLTTYLPDTTETRQGLDLMDEQFTTYGTARIMACNVTLEEAERLVPLIEEMEGVSMLDFGKENYHDMEAQYENWMSSLASEERDEEGKVRVLVQGEFLPEMRLVLSETPEGTVIAGEGTEETGDFTGPVTVRALCADPENAVVELYVNGSYRQISAEVMGSYIEFAMENPGTFRLTEQADRSGWIWIAGVGAAAAVLIVAFIVKGIGRRRKALYIKENSKADIR